MPPTATTFEEDSQVGPVEETAKVIQELADAALGRTARSGLIPDVDRAQLGIELSVIKQHGAVDTMPSPPGALRGLKRFVLRVAAFNWARQRAVNNAALTAFALVLEELNEIRARATQSERRMATAAVAAAEDVRLTLESAIETNASAIETNASAIETIRSAGDTTAEEIERLRSDQADALDVARNDVSGVRAVIEQLEAEAAGLRADLVAARTDLLAQRRQVAALRSEIARVRLGETMSSADEEPLVDRDLQELYARFEAAFRPSTKELQERFEEYLPALEDLIGGVYPVIDIGAGRGEFVELLSAHGIPCRGVDLNADAVAEAEQQGRAVEQAEAIEYLSGLDGESVGAITMFHLIEHLDPSVAVRLLDECLRVTRPGGLLIVETPNPTNLTVGAAAFYLDPSHLRPVTPTYLEFLVRDCGYTDVQTRFLHPLPEYDLDLAVPPGAGAEATKLLLDDVKWALKGPQDYAVIARRPAGS